MSGRKLLLCKDYTDRQPTRGRVPEGRSPPGLLGPLPGPGAISAGPPTPIMVMQCLLLPLQTPLRPPQHRSVTWRPAPLSSLLNFPHTDHQPISSSSNLAPHFCPALSLCSAAFHLSITPSLKFVSFHPLPVSTHHLFPRCFDPFLLLPLCLKSPPLPQPFCFLQKFRLVAARETFTPGGVPEVPSTAPRSPLHPA